MSRVTDFAMSPIPVDRQDDASPFDTSNTMNGNMNGFANGTANGSTTMQSPKTPKSPTFAPEPPRHSQDPRRSLASPDPRRLSQSRRRSSSIKTTYEPEKKAARKPRPQWVLVWQANFWRALMQIGMFLHKLAAPRPPAPAFSHTIETTVAKTKGTIKLHFWVPKSWHNKVERNRKKYALVVNYHGGGFTLGNATDDARWCAEVVEQVGAVVVSVDYRRAPEHYFPTAVEDGVDAILYMVNHADDFGIDVDRIAVSGFSAGANMCFTTPLRLQEELAEEHQEGEDRRRSVQAMERPPLLKSMSRGRFLTKSNKEIAVKAIVAWYPALDYTRTREQRRATAKRIDQQLPQIFTDLFDESYLQPPTMDMGHPYLSPGVAPRHLLAGLPEDILIFGCEWDMLLDETEAFRDRLVNELDKKVHFFLVEEAAHGFDKAPNPIRQPPNIKVHYTRACQELKRLLAKDEIPPVPEHVIADMV